MGLIVEIWDQAHNSFFGNVMACLNSHGHMTLTPWECFKTLMTRAGGELVWITMKISPTMDKLCTFGTVMAFIIKNGICGMPLVRNLLRNLPLRQRCPLWNPPKPHQLCHLWW